MEVGPSMPSGQVKAVLAVLFAERGPPAYFRSDNGPEFIAHELGDWLTENDVRTRYIAPGRPPAWRGRQVAERACLRAARRQVRGDLQRDPPAGMSEPGTGA
ncbi:TPA: hypothetical protein DCY67_00850 [Candidatus Acetothermia bacterium]|nr:hypothetical protein [Candidatus Acetothermia bacterium]